MSKQPPSILESTKPILYETGYEEWPYSYAGSCFPVRWKNNLYIVSAFHCYENHQVKPEDTLYPIPNTNPTKYFGFSHTLRAKINEAKDNKHYDQIILEVSNDIHTSIELNSVNALDICNNELIVSLSDKTLKDVWLRGFLMENPDHEINYAERKIKEQAYLTNGIISARESNFSFCFMLKVKTPSPNNYSLNGMSGSPVYATKHNGELALAGVIIEYNTYTDEFLVIDSGVIKEFLKRVNANINIKA